MVRFWKFKGVCTNPGFISITTLTGTFVILHICRQLNAGGVAPLCATYGNAPECSCIGLGSFEIWLFARTFGKGFSSFISYLSRFYPIFCSVPMQGSAASWPWYIEHGSTTLLIYRHPIFSTFPILLYFRMEEPRKCA